MRRLAALLAVLTTGLAFAQAPAAAPAALPAAKAAEPAKAADPAKSSDREQLRKEIIEEIKREVDARQQKLLDEVDVKIRAGQASAQVARAWEEDWHEEKRRLELIEIDGYLRLRPTILVAYDLNRGPDRWGYSLFPTPFQTGRKTLAGADLRLRFEPTLNVSEDVRVRAQVDVLDNLVLGSTAAGSVLAHDASSLSFLAGGQVPPVGGVNAPFYTMRVKRLYGEVSTPVGLLKFGRMGSHWGLGILTNDGKCLDCNSGDTVDRILFVLNVAGYYIMPMIDFVSEGPTTAHLFDPATGRPREPTGEIYDRDNGDDATGFNLAILRRESDKEIQKKLDAGRMVLDFGAYVTYRTQKYDAAKFHADGRLYGEDPRRGSIANAGWIAREAFLWTPDVWIRFQRKNLRVELEVAGIYGRIGNIDPTGQASGPNDTVQSLEFLQLGGALQGEYKLMEGQLTLGVEVGFASGDKSPGMGNRPTRAPPSAEGPTDSRDRILDGPQYDCRTATCADRDVTNFRFHPEYRVDTILWRDIFGGVTDAMYARPSLRYEVTEGLSLEAAVIYSRAVYLESTPSGPNGSADLGIELNGGLTYLSDDGFVAGLTYAVLFPMAGMRNLDTPGADREAATAQGLRAFLGAKF